MRVVGFLYVDCGKPEYAAMAENMVHWVREAMQDAYIVHMASPNTVSIAGVSRRINREVTQENAPLMIYRLEHLANFPYEQMLLLDVDVVMNRDPWKVFDTPFDMAFTTRDRDAIVDGESIARKMPYNIGVMFSRSPAFWREAHAYVKTLPPDHQQWWGDQLAVKHLADSGRYRIHEISSDPYNYSPDLADEDVTDKFMVHYKGARKARLFDKFPSILRRLNGPQGYHYRSERAA
jgi:hypothetical protein